MAVLSDDSPLVRRESPWWFGCFEPRAALERLEADLESRGILVRRLAGSRVSTIDSLFREIADVFEFPDYFGANWPALAECVRDLEWQSSKGVVLMISDAADVLCREPEVEFQAFLKILDHAGAAWATAVSARNPVVREF